MKLFTVPPQDEPSTDIWYQNAKRCLGLAESSGSVSGRLVQGALLLALYEIANGIYPAAYLSVGYCARLGHALGIHDRKNASQMFPVPGSWTETEELRRIWWGVLVLERYAYLTSISSWT
jgi:hypothetical protein